MDPNGRQFVDFATALDISVGGALLAIHRFLPKGSKIMIEIPSAPVTNNHHKTPRASRQRLYAKAVRVSDGENCKLMGLQFQKPLMMGHTPASPKPAARARSKRASAD